MKNIQNSNPDNLSEEPTTQSPSTKVHKKRQRKVYYYKDESIELLQRIKSRSSYKNPKDSDVMDDILKYVDSIKQDVTKGSEKSVTLKNLETFYKKIDTSIKHLQNETFADHQYLKNILGKNSNPNEMIDFILNQTKLNNYFYKQLQLFSIQLNQMLEILKSKK